MLDLWFDKAIRPKLRGEAYYVRYADDFLILFQYENEARDVLEWLKRRLEKFALEVARTKRGYCRLAGIREQRMILISLGLPSSTQRPEGVNNVY